MKIYNNEISGKQTREMKISCIRFNFKADLKMFKIYMKNLVNVNNQLKCNFLNLHLK